MFVKIEDLDACCLLACCVTWKHLGVQNMEASLCSREMSTPVLGVDEISIQSLAGGFRGGPVAMASWSPSLLMILQVWWLRVTHKTVSLKSWVVQLLVWVINLI